MSTQTLSNTGSVSAVRLTIVRNRSRGYAVPTVKPEVHHVVEELGDTQVATAPATVAAPRPISYTVRIPAAPVKLSFSSQRLGHGLRAATSSVLGLGMTVVLATQINGAASHQIQMGLLSAISLGLGLLAVWSAIQDLFGTVRIDSFGIRLTPTKLGFAIPWRELVRWEKTPVAVKFTSLNPKNNGSVNLAMLTEADRKTLLDALTACAGDKQGN